MRVVTIATSVLLLSTLQLAVLSEEEEVDPEACMVPTEMPPEALDIMDKCDAEVEKRCKWHCYIQKSGAVDPDGLPNFQMAMEKFKVGPEFEKAKILLGKIGTKCVDAARSATPVPGEDICEVCRKIVQCVADKFFELCFSD